MFQSIKSKIGLAIATYLEKSVARYVAFAVIPHERLSRCLQPGDVLLVEGDKRVSVAIKYLTRSTWSHAALYIGPDGPRGPDGGVIELIEADLKHGVHAAPLLKYQTMNTRICRPVGLHDGDLASILEFMVGSLGKQYDLKNVIDLLRYMLPMPPVPARWRRRMLALGSGDPTRAICSTLIAQAFQSVRYPILPETKSAETADTTGRQRDAEILHIRHHSLFTPRDFDLSPYFRVVKPTIEDGFDYKSLSWYEDPGTGGQPASVPVPAQTVIGE